MNNILSTLSAEQLSTIANDNGWHDQTNFKTTQFTHKNNDGWFVYDVSAPSIINDNIYHFKVFVKVIDNEIVLEM